ncbi:MAG: hypothetical protein WKI04_05220 [Ferruginibacter sp.]
MYKISLLLLSIITLITFQSCSKKISPSPATPASANTDEKGDSILVVKNDSIVLKKPDTSAPIRPVVKHKPKEPIPKVITVNDKFAKKSVDGRLYYDLQGKRYWRSNKDGKYYLFNKDMLTDDEFQKPK